MAVQAQRPSNLFFLNTNEQERNNNKKKMKNDIEMEYKLQPQMPPQHPNPFYSIPGTSRKRSREANNIFTDQSQPSTGLHLSTTATQLDHYNDQIDRFLLTQEDHFRRTLADLRTRHYRALLTAADETLSRRLKEKDDLLAAARHRNGELEERVAFLRAESAALQAKARADEAAAAGLRFEIEEAKAKAAQEGSEASDAESGCVDPRREREESRGLGRVVCRSCRRRPAAAVVLPCRHLCLCVACASAGGECCPVCFCVRSACIEVFLS